MPGSAPFPSCRLSVASSTTPDRPVFRNIQLFPIQNPDSWLVLTSSQHLSGPVCTMRGSTPTPPGFQGWSGCRPVSRFRGLGHRVQPLPTPGAALLDSEVQLYLRA